MPEFDSGDLLSKLTSTLDLGVNTTIAPERLYECLSTGQRRIMGILATHVPRVNTIREQLVSGDGGFTYTLSYFPQGHLELRSGRSMGTVLTPAADWDELTDGYVLENQTIRFPGNRDRAFSNGLWARYTRTPGPISAVSQPILEPEHARQGVVYAAAEEFASQGNAMDPTPYIVMLKTFLWGDPRSPGDVGLIGQLKTQQFFQGQGGLSGGAWYHVAEWVRP